MTRVSQPSAWGRSESTRRGWWRGVFSLSGGDRLSVGLGDLSPAGDVVGGVLRVGWIGTGITDWTLPKRLGSSAVTLRASLSGTFLQRRKDVVNQCSEFAVRCLLGRIAYQRYGARLFPWTSGALGGMGLGCDWSQGSRAGGGGGGGNASDVGRDDVGRGWWDSLLPSPSPFKTKKRRFKQTGNEVQELCESRGGSPGFPVPNSPCGLCGRTATFNNQADSDRNGTALIWSG